MGQMGSGSEPVLDAVQDAHEETGRRYRLGCLGDVVVVDLPMSGGVTENGVRALEEVHYADLLARHRFWVGERSVRAKRLRHEVDADDVVSELCQGSDSDFDGLHSNKDGLFVFAEQELTADPLFD